MTDIKPSLEDRMKEACKKYYNNKIHDNPEFYEKEKKRVVNYISNRYRNDEEYRQRVLLQKREAYKRKKELEKQQKLNQLNEIS